MMEKQATSIPERIPIFSRYSNKLLARASEEGVYFWEKITKQWELKTWEELRAEVEAGKSKQSSH